MEVHGCRRRAAAQPQWDGVATVHSMDDLDELLSRSFVLVSCLPGTAATDGLLGARELALMPRGGLLVNVETS